VEVEPDGRCRGATLRVADGQMHEVGPVGGVRVSRVLSRARVTIPEVPGPPSASSNDNGRSCCGTSTRSFFSLGSSSTGTLSVMRCL
jgi:hypothetical protein